MANGNTSIVGPGGLGGISKRRALVVPKGIGMALRFWLCATITTISALVSAGFTVAGLIGPAGGDDFARYAGSRSIALLIAALCGVALRSGKGIAALALVMSLVQGFDGLVGALANDPVKTYGPFVFALANVAALAWLLSAPSER
jgi:hypothetical protein